MKSSETIGAITLALSKVQGEIENATKSKEGYNYKYSDLASILDIARPLLAINELAVTQIPGSIDHRISVETVLMHSSGEWISSLIAMEIEPRKGMTHAQNIGSVITYARRYALAAMIGIAQEDDDAGTKPSATELQKATFHQIVEDGDAIGLYLIKQRVSEDVFTDLFNSGEKGKKMTLKNKVRELEPIGPSLIANLQLAIDNEDDLMAKENLDGISELGFTMLCKELQPDEAAWLKIVNSERLSEQ